MIFLDYLDNNPTDLSEASEQDSENAEESEAEEEEEEEEEEKPRTNQVSNAVVCGMKLKDEKIRREKSEGGGKIGSWVI
jgi:hypothetical protein